MTHDELVAELRPLVHDRVGFASREAAPGEQPPMERFVDDLCERYGVSVAQAYAAINELMQPPGGYQRVTDLVAWAQKILELYGHPKFGAPENKDE